MLSTSVSFQSQLEISKKYLIKQQYLRGCFSNFHLYYRSLYYAIEFICDHIFCFHLVPLQSTYFCCYFNVPLLCFLFLHFISLNTIKIPTLKIIFFLMRTVYVYIFFYDELLFFGVVYLGNSILLSCVGSLMKWLWICLCWGLMGFPGSGLNL